MKKIKSQPRQAMRNLTCNIAPVLATLFISGCSLAQGLNPVPASTAASSTLSAQTALNCPADTGAVVKTHAPTPEEEFVRAYFERDYKTARAIALAYASKGDAEQQANVGLMMERGEGGPQNLHEAAAFYKLAAAKNLPRAQLFLGLMYQTGVGVEKDLDQAVTLLTAAATQGDVYAQENLGWTYAKGTGIHKDRVKARDWWVKCAAQGSDSCQNDIVMTTLHEHTDWSPKTLHAAR